MMTSGATPGRGEGPALPAYRWRHSALALAALAAVLGIATLAGTLVTQGFDRWSGAGLPRAYAAGEIEALSTARLAVFLLAFQIASLTATAAAIVGFSRPGVRLAPFQMPADGVRTIALAAAALVALAAVYTAAIYLVDRDAIADDVGHFASMIQTQSWPLLAIAAIVGAPLAEELAFRGFAFGVLAASPAGPRAAGVATATMWTALHASYSIYGLAAIFLIGLYFAWLRQRTASLVPSLICHSIYNALIFAALALTPEDALDFAAG